MLEQDSESTVIGIDLGGTKILCGYISNDQIIKSEKVLVPKNGTEQDVLDALYCCIDKIFDTRVKGIGIGVPSVVDVKKGIVYDVQNIPSWKKVHLKEKIEKRYKVPTFINNDANCFAIGEKYFGDGKAYENIAAVIIGTGMAAGLVLNGKLYNGANCGAGEFGMIGYKEHNFEYYASGQFFENKYNVTGKKLFDQAKAGNEEALAIFNEYGSHLGNALNALLYAIDPDVIILGGSVSNAYEFYKRSLWESINTLAYTTILDNISIKISSNPEIAVLGAAALYLDGIS